MLGAALCWTGAAAQSGQPNGDAAPALDVALDAAAAPVDRSRLPADVRRFLDRQMDCEHWMGEEPYDAEPRAQIEDAIHDLRCETLERDEAALRMRYAKRADVIAALDEEVAL